MHIYELYTYIYVYVYSEPSESFARTDILLINTLVCIS